MHRSARDGCRWSVQARRAGQRRMEVLDIALGHVCSGGSTSGDRPEHQAFVAGRSAPSRQAPRRPRISFRCARAAPPRAGGMRARTSPCAGAASNAWPRGWGRIAGALPRSTRCSLPSSSTTPCQGVTAVHLREIAVRLMPHGSIFSTPMASQPASRPAGCGRRVPLWAVHSVQGSSAQGVAQVVFPSLMVSTILTSLVATLSSISGSCRGSRGLPLCPRRARPSRRATVGDPTLCLSYARNEK